MRKMFRIKMLSAAMIASSTVLMPMSSTAQQTQIKAPKNKYKVQDDVRLGSQAAAEIDQKFPILNDASATDYIERIGQRLVDAIPSQFQQRAFNYRFKLVNARDLNAFALPGGPMYVNRGMIESARNEGELAGVMAHEISHVALRHATAQATKQGSAKNTLGTIGLILGGAILGGQTGAQLGALGAQAWMTKYSREYESDADTLGAQIMARAGYDPRDLANVFRTIQQEGSGGAPEWLSSHPDPGNRYEKINREAGYLQVAPNPIKSSREFETIQGRLREMPRALSMAEIEKGYRTEQTSTGPTSSGRYSQRVEAPSTRTRYSPSLGWVELNIPVNWEEFRSQDGIQFAPDGAFGDQGITRGLLVGRTRGDSGNLQRNTQAYVDQMLQSNNYLRQRTNFSQINVGGRQGYMTTAAGRSPVTGETEMVTIYTAQLRNGELAYLVAVVPERESYAYNSTFQRIISSLRFND
jgi:Zn-dependent protease with chaperone function